MVVDSGGVDLPIERLRIQQTGEFKSAQDIEDLVLRGSAIQQVMATSNTGVPRSGTVEKLVRIKDIGTVRRGYVEPTTWAMRYDGDSAIALSISNVSGVNVVDLGKALDDRLSELSAMLPVGIETHKVSWQSDLVTESIDIQKAGGKSDYDALMDSALSRLRPVMLAAGTTVLGVAPLLQDVFWVAMAVTIMFGLALGSVLTMILMPVLYACFFSVKAKQRV